MSRVITSSAPTQPANLGLRTASAPPHTDVTEATSGNFRLPQESNFEKWSGVASDLHNSTSSLWEQGNLQQLGSVSVNGFHNSLHQTFLPHQNSDARNRQEPPLLTFSQPQAASTSPLPGSNHNHYYNILNSSKYLNPQMSPYMADTMVDNIEENMQTPVSPVSATHNSPHDTTMGDQQQPPSARKRSHSVMSQQHDQTGATTEHSRAPSIHSQTGAAEEFSPRGSRAFKRGDPPQNEQGKYICDFAESCWGTTFDRKCEWR